MRLARVVRIVALAGGRGLFLSLWLGAGTVAAALAPEGGPGCGGQQTEQEPNDTSATATPVVQSSFERFVGIYGTIQSGDVDWYSFTATPGSRAWLSVDTGVAGPGGSRNSVVSLFAPDEPKYGVETPRSFWNGSVLKICMVRSTGDFAKFKVRAYCWSPGVCS